jgi:hypothetical protein
MTSQPGSRLNAAFYANSVDAFLRASDDEVYAPLASPHGYTLAPEQLSAWRLQLPVLRAALATLAALDPAAPAPWIHLEFDIPRLGRRVDAVLVTSTAVIPIEFKVGAKKFQQADYEQAWDYGLDLKNFHAPSHAAPIFPILCATEAAKSDLSYVLAGGYAHFFATDFDAGGGDVAVDRAFGSYSMRGSESDSYSWDLGFQWEGSWYDFRNGGSLAAAAGAGERGHPGVIPAGDELVLHELQQPAFAEDKVADVQLSELVLVRKGAG